MELVCVKGGVEEGSVEGGNVKRVCVEGEVCKGRFGRGT